MKVAHSPYGQISPCEGVALSTTRAGRLFPLPVRTLISRMCADGRF
jgi:hypothetical protein